MSPPPPDGTFYAPGATVSAPEIIKGQTTFPQPSDEISTELLRRALEAHPPLEEGTTLRIPHVQLPPLDHYAGPNQLVDADGYVALSPVIVERLERIEAKLDLLVDALMRPRYSDFEGLAQESDILQS